MRDLPFKNRHDAGRRLARRLELYRNVPNVLVLGLPRGGVPVAAEVASHLEAPLDVFVVRKLGVPGHEELAMGAIASGGFEVLNDDVVDALRIPPDVIAGVAADELVELTRREAAYRDGRPPLDVRGRQVLVVDDGLATGSTMLAAVRALRPQGPAKLIVAVPVAPPSTLMTLEEAADEVVCLYAPPSFYGVGQFYEDFGQTTDDEVRAALRRVSPCPAPPTGVNVTHLRQ